MMRGEREIALTTPVSLTAFQPSLWDGSSLLRFQAFHAWLRSQVLTGQNPTGSWAVLSSHFMAKEPTRSQKASHTKTCITDYDLASLAIVLRVCHWSRPINGTTEFNNDKRPRWMYFEMINVIIMSSSEFIFLEVAQ
jgi:hypothetical protein